MSWEAAGFGALGHLSQQNSVFSMPAKKNSIAGAFRYDLFLKKVVTACVDSLNFELHLEEAKSTRPGNARRYLWPQTQMERQEETR